MDTFLLGIIFLSVVLGALIKGLAGFGFGILGTALLLNFMPAREAVTLMIIPLLAVNIPLILEAEFKSLKNCLTEYSYFVTLSLLGAFLGIILVGYLPLQVLSIFIGLLAVMYSYFKQDIFWKPKSSYVSRCFTKKWYNQSLLGISSGTVFGASNIGLPFVLYLDKLNTDRKTFAGLLSLIIMATTIIRTAFSIQTGLYTGNLLLISIIAGILGLIVSEIGAKISHKIPNKHLETLTIILIMVAGLRILYNNLI